MALIVEDGSIVAGANGYISVAALDAYWACRNVTLTQSAADKEAAIIVATQYVDLNNKWKGGLVDGDQPLDWPRFGVVDDEGRVVDAASIPAPLQNAVAEYAQRELSAPLQPDVGTTGTLKKVKKKADVIETETEYQEGTGGYFGTMRYPLADNYLVGLTRGAIGGNFGRIGGC
jgi:hypothetical protein